MQAQWLDSAARCLRGDVPDYLPPTQVADWHRRELLLPIADAIQRRHGGFAERLSRADRERYTSALRAAVAVAAGERRILRDVLGTLSAAGIPTLLLKGSALAYTVYRSPWLRARSDIDVLVPVGMCAAVGDAVARLGFAPVREVTHPLITRQRHYLRDASFRAALDVHETLVNPPVLRTLPGFAALFGRAQAVPAISAHAYALATPDALLHALVHRVAHHNSSCDLLWLYDMHLLVQRMREDEWETFVEECIKSRVSRIARDGLHVLQRVLESPIPPRVLARLDLARVEPSAALLGGGLTEWRLQWVNFCSLNGTRERWAFVRAHLTPPLDEVAVGSSRARPLAYLQRAFSGARKWLQPISRER